MTAGWRGAQQPRGCWAHAVHGHRTPNIDWLAAEGMRFTDYYAEASFRHVINMKKDWKKIFAFE